MKLKTIIVILFVFTCFNLSAQKEPELTIAFLANDNIAEVNINQDNFIKAMEKITDLTKQEFKDIPETQKIAILLNIHKTGKPTIELYSNPKLSDDKELQFLEKLNNQSMENTKLVDFPLLILINAKFQDKTKDFKELVIPGDNVSLEYNQADLKEKYELNKKYAREVLSVLSAYQIKVDEKFAGVKNFGNKVNTINFNEPQDIEQLTSKNSDYWRAIMEMAADNQLIPVSKIFMLVSQGKFDQALKYKEIISIFSSTKSISDKYLSELNNRMDLFFELLNSKIQDGITFHDNGNYEKAIGVYKEVLEMYPNSAWAKYELYFSQNALDLKNGKIGLNDRTEWDEAKPDIYQSDPLYHLDVRASNAKEGYLIFRRQAIMELFKNNDKILADVYKYADIAMDLGVYDFAAQLFWLSFTFDKDSGNALYKYLYCLEKLGVTDLKENFKGDFKKEFKKIEENKENEMKKSEIYKAFKNK